MNKIGDIIIDDGIKILIKTINRKEETWMDYVEFVEQNMCVTFELGGWGQRTLTLKELKELNASFKEGHLMMKRIK